MNRMVWSHLKNSWINHRATLMATVTAMSLVLCALSTVLLARQNLVVMADSWGQDSELTVYLDESLKEPSMHQLQKEVSGLENVERVSFISKAESAERFLKRMGHLAPEFLGQNKDNPLPATLDVHLKAGLGLNERLPHLQKLAAQIGEMSGVQDVSFGQGWMTQWSQFVRKFNWATLGFTTVVLLLGFLVVGNAVRVSLQNRKEEIEILELVGATAAWIRAPFIFEGLLIGLVSAVLSLAISSGLNNLMFGYFSDNGWMWVNAGQLQLSFWSAFFVILIGMSFGAIGAYLCVRRWSSDWSSTGVSVEY